MSWGTTTSSAAGSFLHSPENPFGPNAGLLVNIDSQLNPTGNIQVIPDLNVLDNNLQSFNSGVFGQPTPSQIWAFEAANLSRQLAFLVGLSKEMQNKVGGLSRPEWEKRIGPLHDALNAVHEQAKALCNIVDPAFKPPS